MRTVTFTLIAGFLLVATATPVATALPPPVFDTSCPQPGYFIVDYPLFPYLNYCMDGESEDEPTASYPMPGVGVGFSPTCYVGDDVCVDHVCPPVLTCMAGPPHPNVRVYEVPVHLPTRVHGFVEVTAACDVVTPCRVDYDLPVHGAQDVLP